MKTFSRSKCILFGTSSRIFLISVGDTNEKTSSTEFNKIQKFSQNDSSFSVRFYNIKRKKENPSNMRNQRISWLEE